MKNEEIQYILDYFKNLGLVHWHTSKNNSVYFKFKDARLGSIRVADHKSRDNYNYKYELSRDSYTEEDLKNIRNRLFMSISAIEYFDKNAFVAYEKDNYPEVRKFKDINSWRNYIKKRKSKTVFL